MKLLIESDNINDYLQAVPPIIEWGTPLVKTKIKDIKNQAADPKKRAKIAFEFTRDQIQHSFDDKSCISVTISAEEAMEKQEGICFAKAHVLAALLRGMEIPAGFCYQLKNNPKAGYVLHGLNAIYFEDTGWFRVDPRGNKPGVDSEFSIETERLAYPIDSSKGEIDYPNVFSRPLTNVIESMKNSEDVEALFYNRPKGI